MRELMRISDSVLISYVDALLRGAGFFRVPSSARMWRETLADYFREMS